MRKFIKNNLLNLTDTFHEAIASLSDGINVEFLAELQETVVAIGNTVEESEGENSIVVHIMEEICELLYRLSNVSDSSLAKSIVDEILRAATRAKAELEMLPVILEIVFLPYKASMWDCMETIWEAAKADVRCNVRVIPIPYYERNKDKSLGEMHYEGNEYPSYVDITDYKAYSIEDNRPDVIYIHNPYDDTNVVTCVGSEYFSFHLKKYTDCLVYVPYFPTVLSLPEIHSIHVSYAFVDKIVVGSKAAVDMIDSVVSRHKILALGCPKSERIIALSYKNPEEIMPHSFRKKLTTGKSVLYNVSITQLLEGIPEKLSEIERVLNVFDKHPEIILIFRPHPLLEETIHSFGEEYYKKYCNLKERLNNMRNAILDTTADSQISICCANAYMGDAKTSMIGMAYQAQKIILPIDFSKEEFIEDIIIRFENNLPLADEILETAEVPDEEIKVEPEAETLVINPQGAGKRIHDSIMKELYREK